MKNFNHMLSTNMISNCPISVVDISNAESMYGPSIANIKGKPTRSKPRPLIKDDIHITKNIYKHNSKTNLFIDVVNIKGVEFLVSIDRQVKYS